MDILKSHVDSMFSKYKEDKQIRELKNEILSNLEAKAVDLAANGMEYSEAVNIAKDSITSIDHLIDGNIKVYINKLKLEYLQIILLYSIIAWIFTIPIKIMGVEILLNLLFFIFCMAFGFSFFKLYRKSEPEYFNTQSYISIGRAYKIRKTAWVLWFLFIAATVLLTTGLQFGSNIWFSRRVNISGPYQFAVIVLKYLIPFVSIIIPLIINVAPKLILRYEVAYENENQK